MALVTHARLQLLDPSFGIDEFELVFRGETAWGREIEFMKVESIHALVLECWLVWMD